MNRCSRTARLYRIRRRMETMAEKNPSTSRQVMQNYLEELRKISETSGRIFRRIAKAWGVDGNDERFRLSRLRGKAAQ